MTLTEFMRHEERWEEDLLSLKTVLKHRYNDSKITYKNTKEECLQPPETILTTWGPAEKQQPEKKSGKKNNSIEVLSD